MYITQFLHPLLSLSTEVAYSVNYCEKGCNKHQCVNISLLCCLEVLLALAKEIQTLPHLHVIHTYYPFWVIAIHSHSRSRNSRDSEEWLMVAVYIWYTKESCVPQEKRAGHFQWTIRKVKSYFKTWTLSQSLMCTSGCVALNPPVQWQWTPSSILLPSLFLDRSSGTFHRLVVFLWGLFRGKLSPQRHMLIVFKCRDLWRGLVMMALSS